MSQGRRRAKYLGISSRAGLKKKDSQIISFLLEFLSLTCPGGTLEAAKDSLLDRVAGECEIGLPTAEVLAPSVTTGFKLVMQKFSISVLLSKP